MKQSRRAHRTDPERGSLSLELIIIAPIVVLLFPLVLMVSRITGAENAAEQAASSAAREASLARTAPAAQRNARTAAASTFTSAGVNCITPPDVTVDTSGFARPVGQPATVQVTVDCQIPLSDLGLPGAPGSKTVSATFTSTLDIYRERS